MKGDLDPKVEDALIKTDDTNWTPGEPEPGSWFLTITFNPGAGEAKSTVSAYWQLNRWFMAGTNTSLESIFGDYKVTAHMEIPKPYEPKV